MPQKERIKVAECIFSKANLEIIEMCLINQEMRELEDIQNGDDECTCVYNHIIHIRKAIASAIKDLS